MVPATPLDCTAANVPRASSSRSTAAASPSVGGSVAVVDDEGRPWWSTSRYTRQRDRAATTARASKSVRCLLPVRRAFGTSSREITWRATSVCARCMARNDDPSRNTWYEESRSSPPPTVAAAAWWCDGLLDGSSAVEKRQATESGKFHGVDRGSGDTDNRRWWVVTTLDRGDDL